MRIALLHTKDTPRARHLLDCFARGARRHGDVCVALRSVADLRRLDRADVAAQVCWVNFAHGGSAVDLFRVAAFERLRALGKRLLVIDTGFVRDQYEAERDGGAGFRVDDTASYAAHDRHIYYSVGFDGLKNLGRYYAAASPPDRWRALARPLLPYRGGDRHVLLLGQPPRGQSAQHADLPAWYRAAALALRAATDLPVLFRQHPRVLRPRGDRARALRDRGAVLSAVGAGVPDFRWSECGPIAADLDGARCAVSFSTSAAVAAVLAGVPSVTCDRASMAWPVSGHGLGALARLATPPREAWASDLAYCQWTPVEMAAGLPWARLRPHAQGAPTYEVPP